MKNLLEYKGYHTKIEFDSADLVFRGKIEGIKDLVKFESADISTVEEEFHAAVDDYLEFLKEMEGERDMCKALEDMCQHAEEKGIELGENRKLKEQVEKKVKKVVQRKR